MAKGIVIKSDGQIAYIDVDTSKDSGLAALQEAVGGWIELIHITEEVIAYLNEEGKQEELPFNELATDLCEHFKVGLMPGDYIVGNMVLLGSLNKDGENDGECHDLPMAFIKELATFLGRQIDQVIEDGQHRK